MLVIVVVLFLVSWLPFHIMTLYQNFKPQSQREILFFQVFMFSLWLMFSNSCCNPIVYAVCNRNYRREFGRLLRWAFLQLFFFGQNDYEMAFSVLLYLYYNFIHTLWTHFHDRNLIYVYGLLLHVLMPITLKRRTTVFRLHIFVHKT